MGALRRVVVIALFDVVRAYAKPLALVHLVVTPVAVAFGLVALFSSTGAQAPEIAVVDEDGGVAAAAYLEALAAAPYAVVAMSRDEAVEAIATGDRRMALVLPHGFGEAGGFDLELLAADDGQGEAAVALAGWPRVVAARQAAGLPAAGALVARETPRGGGHDGTGGTMWFAFAVFATVVYLVLIGRGAAFQRERSEGRLARTVATGVAFREVVAAMVLGLLVVGTVQAIVFFGTTAALGLPWFAGGVMSFVATVAATLLAAAGVAAAITGFARTPAQIMVWSSTAPILFAMLGGAWVPLDGAPETLQHAARLSPVYWSLEALVGGSVYDGWSSQVVPLAVLTLIGVVGMVAGVQALRRTRV